MPGASSSRAYVVDLVDERHCRARHAEQRECSDGGAPERDQAGAANGQASRHSSFTRANTAHQSRAPDCAPDSEKPAEGDLKLAAQISHYANHDEGHRDREYRFDRGDEEAGSPGDIRQESAPEEVKRRIIGAAAARAEERYKQP